jgi:ketosteroid isomerase-like protein
MNGLRLLFLCGIVLALACRRSSQGERTGPAETAAVQAVDSAFASALNSGNIEAIARTYDDEAWLLPPQAPMVRGQEGIRGFWAGLVRSYVVHLKFGVYRYEIRDDLAYVVGHYHLETTPRSPEVPPLAPEDGKFLEILKRQKDGSWRYLMDMYSANAPPR